MPDFLKELRQRRLLRARRRDREELLLELGALVYELHHQGRRAPELLQVRAAELDRLDHEVRMLEGNLDPATPHPDDVEANDWGGAEAGTGEWQADAGWDETGEWDDQAEETQEWQPQELPEPESEQQAQERDE